MVFVVIRAVPGM